MRYYVIIQSSSFWQVYVELPRNTDSLFPGNPGAGNLVDFLVQECDDYNNNNLEGGSFSAECAAASQQVNQYIEENNAKYKGM